MYFSQTRIRKAKSRKMRWSGNVALMEKRKACRLLVGKPEGRRPLGRPRFRWMDNIKMDLVEIRRSGMEFIDLIEDRNWCRAFVKNGNKPSGSIIFLEIS
jgi:hypothetical protein